ncbi:hypothetical protein OM416_28900 [Paenibacillus sp. LS1]|uniref:hypothetical protein n=1 Tax=Paenibacillus sp. LS1 TaxID=2992120 RepID=UPI002230192F|nr:hypothetical protein [Paenibacillus sp. LS1]MCW3795626.1 hypothetical protein [Paenibacillus sp. LS1]
MLASEFKNKELDRDLIAGIWIIQFYSNMWVGNGRMLENALTEDQRDLIKKWTEIMSYTVTMLLENSEEAYYEYNNYLEGKSQNYVKDFRTR